MPVYFLFFSQFPSTSKSSQSPRAQHVTSLVLTWSRRYLASTLSANLSLGSSWWWTAQAVKYHHRAYSVLIYHHLIQEEFHKVLVQVQVNHHILSPPLHPHCHLILFRFQMWMLISTVWLSRKLHHPHHVRLGHHRHSNSRSIRHVKICPHISWKRSKFWKMAMMVFFSFTYWEVENLSKTALICSYILW